MAFTLPIGEDGLSSHTTSLSLGCGYYGNCLGNGYGNGFRYGYGYKDEGYGYGGHGCGDIDDGGDGIGVGFTQGVGW